jgi:sporulation protein YlmC with PRC-barrel domain
MQFKGGADVLTASNDTVGKVDRVVLDPRTKQVTHLVVRKGCCSNATRCCR